MSLIEKILSEEKEISIEFIGNGWYIYFQLWYKSERSYDDLINKLWNYSIWLYGKNIRFDRIDYANISKNNSIYNVIRESYYISYKSKKEFPFKSIDKKSTSEELSQLFWSLVEWTTTPLSSTEKELFIDWNTILNNIIENYYYHELWELIEKYKNWYSEELEQRIAEILTISGYQITKISDKEVEIIEENILNWKMFKKKVKKDQDEILKGINWIQFLLRKVEDKTRKEIEKNRKLISDWELDFLDWEKTNQWTSLIRWIFFQKNKIELENEKLEKQQKTLNKLKNIDNLIEVEIKCFSNIDNWAKKLAESFVHVNDINKINIVKIDDNIKDKEIIIDRE